MPKNRPTATATPKAKKIDQGATTGLHADDREAAADQADDDADERADDRQQHRLGDELHDDVGLGGADRLADADLARSLGDGDQHDVHDADAADEQAQRGDRTEQHRQRLASTTSRPPRSRPGSARCSRGSVEVTSWRASRIV